MHMHSPHSTQQHLEGRETAQAVTLPLTAATWQLMMPLMNWRAIGEDFFLDLYHGHINVVTSKEIESEIVRILCVGGEVFTSSTLLSFVLLGIFDTFCQLLEP